MTNDSSAATAEGTLLPMLKASHGSEGENRQREIEDENDAIMSEQKSRLARRGMWKKLPERNSKYLAT